jgi:serine/threonine-protein kinase
MPSAFPHDRALTTGQLVDERYRVVRQIGAGGMGAIYEAEQTILGRKVALKVTWPQPGGEAMAAKRFLREARAASQIEHRNVVKISDFGELPGGATYYVMEYLEGRDLSQLLKAEGPQPWARARGIFLELVTGLQAAHDAGVVHRDVKPANCFLARKGDQATEVVKVIDFGVAKQQGSETNLLTGSSEILGTVRYMSPEQATGAPVDARSDIYATGILMYETLTGEVPFGGDNIFAVMRGHTHEPPRPPRELDPEIPEAVETVILRALAKDPADRFATMLELRLAIVAINKKGRGPREGAAIVTGETMRASAVHYAQLSRSGRTVAVPTTGPRDAVTSDRSSPPSYPPTSPPSYPPTSPPSYPAATNSGPILLSSPATPTPGPRAPKLRFESVAPATRTTSTWLVPVAVVAVLAALAAVAALFVIARGT